MKDNIDDFVKGWLMGDFEPSLFKTSNFEIAIQKYSSGVYEKRHIHKIATEWTIIVKGKVVMNSIEYNEGDIITIKPNHSTDFLALTETTTLVIKIPSIKEDKYLV
jgi:quercetin dioxygenase-like cupin family protein